MIVANRINNGNCAECGAKGALEIRLIVEGDLTYGQVACVKCHEWITDVMPEELAHYGITLDDSRSSTTDRADTEVG